MNQVQQLFIEVSYSGQKIQVLRQSVRDAGQELGVNAYINQDGTIGGDWTEEQYWDGIIEDIAEKAIRNYNESVDWED